MSIEIINSEEYIPKRLASLYMDVSCYECGKLIALANAVEIDSRKYCRSCCIPLRKDILGDKFKSL